MNVTLILTNIVDDCCAALWSASVGLKCGTWINVTWFNINQESKPQKHDRFQRPWHYTRMKININFLFIFHQGCCASCCQDYWETERPSSSSPFSSSCVLCGRWTAAQCASSNEAGFAPHQRGSVSGLLSPCKNHFDSQTLFHKINI